MRSMMLAGTVPAFALLACVPGTAVAQDAASPSPAPPTTGETGDIVVTARQRAESLEKVPLAVSVVGEDLIRRSYTVNTQQLSLLVPALNYSSANPRNTAFTIRGLGSSVVAVSQAGNSGLVLGTPSDPRVIGVTLRAKQ